MTWMKKLKRLCCLPKISPHFHLQNSTLTWNQNSESGIANRGRESERELFWGPFEAHILQNRNSVPWTVEGKPKIDVSKTHCFFLSSFFFNVEFFYFFFLWALRESQVKKLGKLVIYGFHVSYKNQQEQKQRTQIVNPLFPLILHPILNPHLIIHFLHLNKSITITLVNGIDFFSTSISPPRNNLDLRQNYSETRQMLMKTKTNNT